MRVPPRPTALARPSVAHRRWWAHRVALALADRLADPQLWASGACWVRLDGAIRCPLAVVSEVEPPVDGVVDAAGVRLVVQHDAGGAPPPRGQPEIVEAARWHAGGVETSWRLQDRSVEIVDAAGARVVVSPCQLHAPVLARPLPWPLPLTGRPRQG